MNAPRNPEQYTFEVGGVSVTLARRTNRHALMADRVRMVLDAPDDDSADFGYKRLFGRMVAQSVDIEGDLPFVLPASTAPPDELRAAYEAFLEADGVYGDQFHAALNTVNAPLGPRAFLPPEQLSDDEKKGSPPSGGRGGRTGAPSSGGSPPATTTNPA